MEEPGLFEHTEPVYFQFCPWTAFRCTLNCLGQAVHLNIRNTPWENVKLWSVFKVYGDMCSSSKERDRHLGSAGLSFWEFHMYKLNTGRFLRL